MKELFISDVEVYPAKRYSLNEMARATLSYSAVYLSLCRVGTKKQLMGIHRLYGKAAMNDMVLVMEMKSLVIGFKVVTVKTTFIQLMKPILTF